MRKLNQEGAVGPLEIAAILLVVAVVGFTGYRIGNARTEVSDITANAQEEDGADEAARLALKEAEENSEKEVEVPKEEEKKEVEPEPEQKDEVVKDEPIKDEVKDKPTYINFTKGGSNQDGQIVTASATLESEQTGTCYIKFLKDGQSKVTREKTITNNKTCSTQINVAEFPVGGSWDLHIWFVSSDGKVEAYQDAYPVEITK